jgi:uncharacterized protein (DUF1697 family)
MTIYIALLRGINVSGHNKIKMADLKSTLAAMGLGRVQTYIQSGNVLFESQDQDEPLRQRIEQEIKTVFGLAITVILRTDEELERIIRNCPYDPDSLLEGQSIHLTSLSEPPSQKALDILSDNQTEIDEYHIDGQEMYFLFRQSILDSKLAKSLQKLGNTGTSRNWNTIMKLDALAKAMKA